jgi:GT2 family glycosyltransferase
MARHPTTMESVKDINIVFVNYFMKDEILHAVASVRNDISDCPYAVQITVSDNSQNQDGIKEALAAQFPMVRYIDCGENVGFGKGNTIGFMATPARYYFALNPDIIIPENSRGNRTRGAIYGRTSSRGRYRIKIIKYRRHFAILVLSV